MFDIIWWRGVSSVVPLSIQALKRRLYQGKGEEEESDFKFHPSPATSNEKKGPIFLKLDMTRDAMTRKEVVVLKQSNSNEMSHRRHDPARSGVFFKISGGSLDLRDET